MRKLAYKIFLSVNVLFAFALLISYLAVIINPGHFAFPALFGLAYPYLLLVNIIFILVWAVFLKIEALISLLVIIAGINHFSNYIKLGKPSGDKTGTFKVLSYNVRLFNHFENKINANSEKEILELIRNRQPDIICLQEFYFMGNPEQKENTFMNYLGSKYHSHLKIIGSGKDRHYGIITISKFPIINKGDIVHPGSPSLSIYSDIIIENDTFRIYNNHLQSFRLKNTVNHFLSEIKGLSNEKETFSELKSISLSLTKGFVYRAVQAKVLKGHINKSPHPVIVIGDFNDTPVSYSYRKIREGLNDAFITSGYGAGFTYKGNYPANRIDYILYDGILDCRQFDIIKIRYSDHYPIVAYFRKEFKREASSDQRSLLK